MADFAIEKELLVVPGSSEASFQGRPSTSRRYIRLAIWIALTDILIVELSLVLTRLIRFGIRPAGPNFALLLLLAPLVWVPVFVLFSLYGFSRMSPAEEFRRLLEATAAAVGIKLLLDLVFGRDALDALSRGWVALTWLIAVVLSLSIRQVWHKYMGRLRARGELTYRTVIIGANEEAVRIAHSLKPKVLGYAPIGLIETGALAAERDGLPVLGSVEDLSDVIRQQGVECVFVASTAVNTELMKRIGKLFRRHQLEVRVSANVAEILSSRLTVQPVGDLLALSLRPVRLSGAQAIAKRTFDLAVCGLIVIVSAPLWLAISTLIKLTSRGPVLYKQERVGQNARPFTMYKFRSMIRRADLMLPELLDKNEFAGGVLFKLRDDPRVTRVGKWLRKWSLDELPQLINVLKGNMSLVGPRPALPNEVATYEDWHRDRLEVRPGITGLWQVGGRSELSFDDYVRLDLFYIENWSIVYDLFILGKTIPAVLLRKGAY